MDAGFGRAVGSRTPDRVELLLGILFDVVWHGCLAPRPAHSFGGVQRAAALHRAAAQDVRGFGPAMLPHSHRE